MEPACLTSRRLAPLLFVLAVIACTQSSERPATERARAADTSVLAARPETLPRPLGTVAVALKDGRTRRFVDRGDEESIVRHRDDGALPGVPVRVVFREMWEAWDYVLVDLRTGDTVVVPAAPVVSPTGRRLAVTSEDFRNGYAPTVVEVWRIEPTGLVLEWREVTGESYPENTGWGASDWRWEDDSTARIVRTVPRGEDGPHASRPARLLLRRGRWRLDSLSR